MAHMEMKANQRSNPRPRAGEILRWQFRMHDRMITCGVSRLEGHQFSVVTLPHWDIKSGIVETFDDPASALRRHALIAEELRSAGWSVASYTR
jgi:hypothetical protein